MVKKQEVTIASAMGQSKYTLSASQLLRLTDFATQMQMEQDRPTAVPAANADCMDQEQNRTMKQTSKELLRQDLDEGPYNGFLLIRCEECGKVHGYNSRRLTYTSRCKECGAVTPLGGLRMAHLQCSCGRKYSYKTNITEPEFTHACLDCHARIKAKLNWRGDTYVTDNTGNRA